MRSGRAEQGHDRIADEFLHGAPAPLELRTDTVVVRAEDRAHLLGIELLRLRGEADEVAEEHGDDLALLPRSRNRNQRRAAHPAEAEAIGILLAAARARDHA